MNNEQVETILDNEDGSIISKKDLENDLFLKDHPDLFMFYLSINRYSFYTNKNNDIVYKVCQRNYYADEDDYKQKKLDLDEQMRIINKDKVYNFAEIIDGASNEKYSFYATSKVKNIRELCYRDLRIEWNEIKGMISSISEKFIKKYVNDIKNIAVKSSYEPASDEIVWKEYVQTMNELSYNFGVKFANKLPEKMKTGSFFPEQHYKYISNLTTENIFLDRKFNIKLLDPKFKTESLPYFIAEFEIMTDKIDNIFFGYHPRWSRFIDIYFKEDLKKTKEYKKIDKDVLDFYVGLRYLEKAKEWLVRDHDKAGICLKNALSKFSELGVEVTDMGILKSNSKKKK